MKKGWICLGVMTFILLLTLPAGAAVSGTVGIVGAVKQPLQLTLNDLARFQTVAVRLNELGRDKSFHGAFQYRGVPLKELLELAAVQKGEGSFPKPLDMAIVVRNREGKQTVLSWGEVFYRNPGEIVVAIQAEPIMPLRDCASCHKPEVYGVWLDPLKRKVGFPKLAVVNDLYRERSLEDIVSIEVVDPHLKMPVKRLTELFAPDITLVQGDKKLATLTNLSAYSRLEVIGKVMGDGKGYHGLLRFEGVSLLEILTKAGVTPDLNTAVVVSAPDGYRSLISMGELALSPLGRRIIIADRKEGQPIQADGRFKLVIPDELSADRWVKSVSRIEVINLQQNPKATLISVGCADPDLMTRKALSALGRADVVVCTEDIKKRFGSYIGNRPILFDPFKFLMPEPIYGKELAKLSPEEKKALLDKKTEEAVQLIREQLRQGKNVALLEYGDPFIYGSLRQIAAGLEEGEKEFVPGISAFNAANALIGKEMACRGGSIILSTAWTLKDNPVLLQSAAEKGDTLALFMGLKELPSLVEMLGKHYSPATPLYVAYRVGFADSERLVKTTLDQALKITWEDKEKFLGMIYVGPCLESKTLDRHK
jgi:siroheme synthase